MIIVAVAALVALLVLVGALRRPAEPGRDPLPGAADVGPPGAGRNAQEADEFSVEWGLYSRETIQRRLDALNEELERLDHDPDVFAKAFHIMVARAAYDALVADAARVPDAGSGGTGEILDMELLGPATGRLEELDV